MGSRTQLAKAGLGEACGRAGLVVQQDGLDHSAQVTPHAGAVVVEGSRHARHVGG